MDEVHGVGEPVALEERARDAAEDEPREQRPQRLGPLLLLRVLELLGGEGLVSIRVRVRVGVRVRVRVGSGVKVRVRVRVAARAFLKRARNMGSE